MGNTLAAEPLLALAVTVTSEQRVDSVLQSIVQGLASQPGVALARIWLLPSADLPRVCHAGTDPSDDLSLVASAGTPINSPGEDWCFLQGHFARMPFSVGKVGQVAASRHPILIEDVAAKNDWVVRPEWAKREQIRSFAGHPLIFRDKLLGVIAVFSRQPLGQQEFTWLGLFANQAALAIANARAEEALQSSERNLSAIIDTIPTLAWCNLPDGSNEFLNKGWHEYTGLSPEESHGWGWQVAFHPEDLPPLMEKWQKMLVSGESDEIEARLRRHDGVYRWFLIRAQALRNDSGKIVRWYGTSTDIEDRKRAEEARRASERNLAAIINTIPTLAWSAGPDGSAEFLNRRWLDYTGMSEEQAQGWGWGAAIHPDDVNGLVEHWQSALASGLPMEVEARMRRFDGAYRRFLFRANPLRDETGKILKWYGTNVDIEDRKRVEEGLRASEFSWREIVDTIPGLVATTSAMGEVEFLNRQTLEYFGKTTEELKDWALISAVHPDDLPRVVETRKESIETGQIYEVEHRCRRADGVYRWFQVRGIPVRDTENKITAWYLLLTDIEDRKRAEQALQQTQVYLSEGQRLAHMGSWAFKAAGFDYWSSELFQVHGLDPRDKPPTIDEYLNLVHPEDREFMQQGIQKMLADHLGFDFTKRIVRPDGKIRHVRSVGVPVADGAAFQGFVGTGMDVTEQEELVQKLRQSEADLRTITDAIRQSIVVLTPDGATLYANRVALDNTGLTMDEVKDDGFFRRAFHPDDVDRVRDERHVGLLEGVPFDLEIRALFKNGEYRWQLLQYNPLKDEQGQIVRWYVTATDIDDRKRAEARVEQAYLRLAEAQRLSKTGSFITDLLADNHDWSEEAFRIFEFDPSTKVTVRMIRDIVHPEDLPTFDAVIARGMTGTDVDFVFRIVPARGAVKHLRGMARVMTQVGANPLFIGALQDVTESKIAEGALNKARSELAEVARITTLNALTASIAHEVNQPLSGIITNASTCLRMLSADPPNVDGARETARRTIRDGNRASDVIQRLRALFSKKEFTLEPLDLNEAAREVITLFSDSFRENEHCC